MAKIRINKDFKEEKINLNEFKKQDVNTQINIIKETLSKIYLNTEILHSWIMSCIELSNNVNDDVASLPARLLVKKEENDLVFQVIKPKKSTIIILILFITAFLVGGIASGYLTYKYIHKANVNNDIDGDKYPDINIDINNDKKADINIDTNNDKKPDVNIDYKGNRKAVFNIDTDEDGKADFNYVTKKGKNNKCGVNCDINEDGWPDLNIDIDGDGKADLDIDTDGDNIADTNIDINGDGMCDYMCDSNGDYVCDFNCYNSDLKDTITSGPTTSTGEPSSVTTSGGLVITYDNVGVSTNVLPNDMAGASSIPDRSFTVENTSDHTLKYKLVWKINKNDFKTNNLQYKLTSTNGGAQTNLKTVPKSDAEIISDIEIPARSIQKYYLSIIFVGTNQEQNIDTNREFNGIITAEYQQ